MYRLGYDYEHDHGLCQFLDSACERFDRKPPTAVLFHILSDTCDIELTDHVAALIAARMPEALLVGGSTGGNIFDGELASRGDHAHIAITCDVFEDPDAKLEVLQYPFDYESQDETIQDLLDAVAQRPWVKAVESLSTIVDVNTPELCSKASELPSGIAWFGGVLTGPETDHWYNAVPYTFSSAGAASTHGIAFVLYGGENLHVLTQATAGWKPLGMSFEVTSVERDRLIELDGQPAYDVYYRYLKIQNDENFLRKGLLFPFTFGNDDMMRLKTPTRVNEDGSLTMTSDISGERRRCRIVYGDPAIILHDIKHNAQAMQEFAPQAILAFSCSARRYYWGDDYVSRETRPFELIAPTTGFFTAGEFIRIADEVLLCNVTLVVVGLREGEPEAHEAIDLRVEDEEFSRQIDIVQIMSSFISEAAADAQRAMEQLEHVAKTDGLTQLNNRREAERILETAIADYNRKLAQADDASTVTAPMLAMIDLDDFKQVNDVFGHKAGDAVLIRLAELLQSHFSHHEGVAHAGRWGGEEFVIVLDGYSMEEARAAVDGLRVRFSEVPFEGSGNQTMSLGLTQVRPGESADAACSRVDQALYEAKRTGKNKVVVG